MLVCVATSVKYVRALSSMLGVCLVRLRWGSFVICWSPLGVFGAHPAFLGATLASLLGPLGAPWAPKAFSLVSLWLSWDAVGPFGHLGLPNGAWADFGSKMDVLFRANTPPVKRLRIKSDLAELSAASGASAVSTQSGARAAAPNPTSLAPGARMTVVQHTPLN